MSAAPVVPAFGTHGLLAVATPSTLDDISCSVARVAIAAPSAGAHQLQLLIDELDVLAENLVGRHDPHSVAQKQVIQTLVHKLCPSRGGNPRAITE